MIITWPTIDWSPRLAAGLLLVAALLRFAHACHAPLVARLQRRIAAYFGGDGWVNLGTAQAPSYAQACEALACAVCDATRINGGVVSVGCGTTGRELAWLADRYACSVTGVDAAARDQVFKDPRLRLFKGSAHELVRLCGTGHGRVVAVDCAYHFVEFELFLKEAFRTLAPGGRLSFSHVCGRGLPRQLCRLLGVHVVSSIDALKRCVARAGFVSVEVRVLPGILERWRLACGGRLAYVVVTADRPASKTPRPRVAVVGGGLSGLASAFRLRRAGCAVTLFERSPQLGLARHEWRGAHGVVDVPLRMLGEGYYTSLLRLCRDARVATTRARVDCSFTTGEDVIAYSKSRLGNLGQLRRVGLMNALRLDRALRCTSKGSWGSFLNSHDLKDANPAVALLNAQLSWVLSASYEAVRHTPAAAILEYVRGLSLSLKTCVAGGRNHVVRITPSIRALERALSFGCDVRLNRAVCVEKERVIDGVQYDAVVVATSPGCTRSVLPGRADLAVFDEFKSETRSLVLHRDASLMPSHKRDWRALNVMCASPNEAASLTVWLNAFYPEMQFEGDVFETWAPRKAPLHVVAEVALPRVVQTADQARLHAAIAALQGRGGVHFAGAHAVPGMGLLEQACAAGDAAAADVVVGLRARGFAC